MSLSRTTGAGAVASARPLGGRYSLPVFSFFVSLAIVLVSVIAPDASAHAAPAQSAAANHQRLSLVGEYTPTVVRDDYRVTMRPTSSSTRRRTDL